MLIESISFIASLLTCGHSIFGETFLYWKTSDNGALVVTSNQNHQIIHLFTIIEILNKIFEYHRIQKFSKNADLKNRTF